MFQTLNLKVFNHFHILQIHRFQRLLDAGFTYFSLDQQIWTVGLENYSFHEGESICLAAKLTNVLIPNKFFNRIWLWNLPPSSFSPSPLHVTIQLHTFSASCKTSTSEESIHSQVEYFLVMHNVFSDKLSLTSLTCMHMYTCNVFSNRFYWNTLPFHSSTLTSTRCTLLNCIMTLFNYTPTRFF